MHVFIHPFSSSIAREMGVTPQTGRLSAGLTERRNILDSTRVSLYEEQFRIMASFFILGPSAASVWNFFFSLIGSSSQTERLTSRWVGLLFKEMLCVQDDHIRDIQFQWHPVEPSSNTTDLVETETAFDSGITYLNNDLLVYLLCLIWISISVTVKIHEQGKY